MPTDKEGLGALLQKWAFDKELKDYCQSNDPEVAAQGINTLMQLLTLHYTLFHPKEKKGGAN